MKIKKRKKTKEERMEEINEGLDVSTVKQIAKDLQDPDYKRKLPCKRGRRGRLER